MPSDHILFQQVVTKAAPRETRRLAVDELGRLGAIEQLKTLAQINGIDGVLRRDAIRELETLGATDALATIGADRAADDSIREQARR